MLRLRVIQANKTMCCIETGMAAATDEKAVLARAEALIPPQYSQCCACGSTTALYYNYAHIGLGGDQTHDQALVFAYACEQNEACRAVARAEILNFEKIMREELPTATRGCTVCNSTSKSLQPCPRCEAVSYCSVECQTKDWPKHKQLCVGGKKAVPCPVCLKQGTSLKACSRCYAKSYCSPVCQRQDWPAHKLTCVVKPQ